MVTKEEVEKQFMLAICEKEYLSNLINTILDKCPNKINELDAISTLHQLYSEKIGLYLEEYVYAISGTLSHKNKQLEDIHERLSYTREGVHVLTIKISTELTTAVAMTVMTRKNEVRRALGNGYRFKKNIKTLDETLGLEDYPGFERDHKIFVEYNKKLSKFYTRSKNTLCNFTEQLIAAQNKVTNSIRFLDDTPTTDGETPNELCQNIEKYKAELSNLRQRITLDCEILLAEENNIIAACNEMLRLVKKSDPDSVRPSTDRTPVDYGRRTEDVPKELLDLIIADRDRHFNNRKPVEDKDVAATTDGKLFLASSIKVSDSENDSPDDKKQSRFRF